MERGGVASSCGSLPRDKTGHKAMNESVNKWKDMDKRLKRNRRIPLSTFTEVDIHFKWFTAIKPLFQESNFKKWWKTAPRFQDIPSLMSSTRTSTV
jgi:hypothetical protein